MAKRKGARYVLPDDGVRPRVSIGQFVVWTLGITFILVWIILSVKVEIPVAEAQVESIRSQPETRSLRRREVKALESIASTLKEINSKLDRR